MRIALYKLSQSANSVVGRITYLDLQNDKLQLLRKETHNTARTIPIQHMSIGELATLKEQHKEKFIMFDSTNMSKYNLIGKASRGSNRYIVIRKDGLAYNVDEAGLEKFNILDKPNREISLEDFDNSIKLCSKYNNIEFMSAYKAFQEGYKHIMSLGYRQGSTELISAWKSIARPLVRTYWNEAIRSRNNNIKKLNLMGKLDDHKKYYLELDLKTLAEFNALQFQLLHITEIYNSIDILYKITKVYTGFSGFQTIVQYAGGIVNGEIIGFMPPLLTLDYMFEQQTCLVKAPELPPEALSMIGTFMGCIDLKTIGDRLPNKVKNIRHLCDGCVSLDAIHIIPDTVEDKQDAFNKKYMSESDAPIIRMNT